VPGTIDSITARAIRSIDGIGPALRLAISNEMDFPPGYVPPCELAVCCPSPENSYRDPWWVTGSDARWTAGAQTGLSFELRVWPDGTARLGSVDGQWFTSNNIAFVFVPSSGASTKLAYITLGEAEGSLISDVSFMRGGFLGRIVKTSASPQEKPVLSGLKSGEELAAAAGDDYRMVDMQSIPESARKQDPRLLDTAGDCWFQDNTNLGGTHHFRQDVDAAELRFALIEDGKVSMLASGTWWTLNNTFLHVEHDGGYVAEYLYTVTPDGFLFHSSYMGYERGDVRMLQRYDNSGGKFPATCIDRSCSDELPKGAAEPAYATMEAGQSTFQPVPCPSGGCK